MAPTKRIEATAGRIAGTHRFRPRRGPPGDDALPAGSPTHERPPPGYSAEPMAVRSVGDALTTQRFQIWRLYVSGQTVWAAVLLVWSLLTGSLDNVLRPMLIRSGADLLFILIFAGVLGGMLAFGPIGLFIGPVVLAVTYTLLTYTLL